MCIILAGHSFEERELIGRVMRNMRTVKRSYGTQRWVRVMHTFCVGSTVAYALCEEFGYDPEEQVTKK